MAVARINLSGQSKLLQPAVASAGVDSSNIAGKYVKERNSTYLEIAMKLGLFLPTASNGWIISENSPQFDPGWPMMLDICQRAERYGIDFALAMVKLHGFGGKTGFWDHSLEAFSLVGGLAARTEKLTLIPSVPVLAIPPPICARMISTLDSIAPGRIALNIVTGWQKAEYDQMGLWPEFYDFRYKYASEYVQVLHDLWSTGYSDFKGEYFQMNACQLLPRPSARIDVVCAGASDDGIAFCATYGDYNFVTSPGLNQPGNAAKTAQRVLAAGNASGRPIGIYVAIIVISADSSQEAFAKWEFYRAGIDHEAIRWMVDMAKSETSANDTSSIQQARSAIDVNMGNGVLIGSHAEVAAMLDELAGTAGVSGVMLELADWDQGLDDFGTKVRPLMKSLERLPADTVA